MKTKKLFIGIICAALLIPYSLAIEPNNAEKLGNLSKVKVAILYQRVTDGIYYLNRSVDDVINILKETKTDFIFLGWWRMHPIPESPDEEPGFFTAEEIEEATRRGLTYEHLRNAIAKIKSNNPDIVFCGGVGLEFLNAKRERNPLTGEIFEQEETWDMALDPRKWNIPVSKKEFQCWVAKELVWIDPSLDCKDYDPQKAPFYFPDVTNPDFQELFLSWMKKQIDYGADAIWIDMLFSQAGRLLRITKNPHHPAVRESFEAASEIVDKIHEYGLSKGRYIYVGTWDQPTISMPYPPPNLDFVTLANIPSSREVYSMELNEEKCDNRIAEIREKLGDVHIFAFMDFGFPNSPVEIFSQNLTPEEQREFLRIADIFFSKKDIIFIYPVHGGFMGWNPKVLSFGKFNVYDALAPEFDTYGTIVELAENRAQGKPLVGIERPSNYLYILDREIVPLKMPIIIGKITIMADAYDEDGINKVEFYVDEVLKSTDYEEPYSWLWNESAIGRHEIKIIAYDNSGNKAEDMINVMIFNLGLR